MVPPVKRTDAGAVALTAADQPLGPDPVTVAGATVSGRKISTWVVFAVSSSFGTLNVNLAGSPRTAVSGDTSTCASAGCTDNANTASTAAAKMTLRIIVRSLNAPAEFPGF